MDWFDALGNYAGLLPDTPALAVDMAGNRMSHDRLGYRLAFGLQDTSTPLEVYPPDNPFLAA